MAPAGGIRAPPVLYAIRQNIHIQTQQFKYITCASYHIASYHSTFVDLEHSGRSKNMAVMILSFQTDRPGQTVQTQIRLLQSDPRLHCLQFPLHHLDALL